MDRAEYQASRKKASANLLPWAMGAWSECRVSLCNHQLCPPITILLRPQLDKNNSESSKRLITHITLKRSQESNFLAPHIIRDNSSCPSFLLVERDGSGVKGNRRSAGYTTRDVAVGSQILLSMNLPHNFTRRDIYL